MPDPIASQRLTTIAPLRALLSQQPELAGQQVLDRLDATNRQLSGQRMATSDEGKQVRVLAPRPPRTPELNVTWEGLTDEWFIRAAKEMIRLRSFLPDDDPDAWTVDDDSVDKTMQ